MAEYTTSAYLCAPTGSAGASVTSTGTSMSAWSQLIASMSAAGVIHGLWANINSGGGVYLEIGAGPAASEVVIAQINMSGTVTQGASIYWLPVPVNVASGARISWRMQPRVSTNATHYAKAIYIAAQQPETMTSTSVVPSYFSTSTELLPSGTPWANGAWVQVTASAPSDVAISQAYILTSLNAIGSEWEIDIGVGAAASEVVIATLRWVNMQNFGNQHGVTVPMPLIASVLSGNRVAMRARSNQGSTLSIFVGLNYYPVPL